ncbi:UNVERIFIED_CONTAM: AAA-ATPase [Sesamum radiatum]|uniref:AAA-ATPase n=1 Tax=Sesamum radiatum TaxID=300843 RepID=A0AAW2RGW8_SESRA
MSLHICNGPRPSERLPRNLQRLMTIKEGRVLVRKPIKKNAVFRGNAVDGDEYFLGLRIGGGVDDAVPVDGQGYHPGTRESLLLLHVQSLFRKLLRQILEPDDCRRRRAERLDAERNLRRGRDLSPHDNQPLAERLKANKSTKQKNISLSMAKGQELTDSYKGSQLKWQFILVEPDGDKGRFQSEKRYFELTFDKQNKDTVLNDYLPFVLAKAKEMKENERAVKLYTRDCPFDDNYDGGNGGGYWGCINLDHPATFDKLAMDPNLKRSIIEDLDRFLRRKDYYRKVGKAWKRGYLLYGPPGTGKSSLIAAIANYLRFDVYDLELTSVYSNSELRRILLCTNSKSILVIEDIDCSTAQLTLSGLLNFIDGLWSTVGDERIIIFTTNHKEKLDPALLRPGRMDMHIHMGYCTPKGFDVLASNYLGINDHHRLVPEIKRLIQEVDITPAEIAEHLMRSEDVDLAL